MAALLLRNRHLLVLTIVVLAIGGLAALGTLPRLEDPRLTNRNPVVLTFLPGADPEQVEALITEPLERALREVDEVKRIESTSSLGVSSIAMELADRVADPAPALADLRSAIDRVAGALPPGATRPWLDDQRGATAYGAILALRWRAAGDPAMDILSRHADELASRLRNLPGTELVRVQGAVDERLLVEVDAHALARRGFAADHLAASLAAADVRAPAGVLRADDGAALLTVGNVFDASDAVRGVALADDAGRTTTVGDIAAVRREPVDPPVAIGTVDGERSVFVAARMRPDQLASTWARAVHERAAAFAAEVGGTTRVDVVFDQSRYTDQRLAGLAANLAMGALLIWLVVALIMGWRQGTLVALALPLCAAAILIALQVLAVPLHQISVFGLLVAMGLLIDNAIVVTDEVGKLRRQGLAATAAATTAVRHLAVPLFASTATTALSFAPILLLQGNVGEFVGTIATSVIVAISLSLLLSLTVVAALAALLPPDPARSPRAANAPRRLRLPGPRLRAALAIAPALLGFALVPTLEQQFFPAADRDQFQIELWSNPAAAIDRTQRLVERLDATLRAEPDVRRTMWLAGQSIPSVYYNQVQLLDDAPFYAQGVVTARDAAAAKRLVERCTDELARLAPEAQVVVRAFGQGPPVDAPVILRLVGDDLDALVAAGDEVRGAMSAAPGMVHTRASIPNELPTPGIDFDESRLVGVGLSPAAASRQLRALLDGALGALRLEGTRRVPVMVRAAGPDRRDPAELAGLPLVAPGGAELPLAAVADVAVTARFAAITRRDGERCNELYGFVEPDALPIEVFDAVAEELAVRGFRPPPGVRLEVGGDAEESNQAAAQLLRYVPLLGAVIAATLVLSFRSVLLAALLATVGALAAGYGLLALWLGGYPLGFNPLIGLAGLIGVTFNDSIVVLAAIRGDAAARAGDPDAIHRAVRDCNRHVWATTLTTALGFAPLLVFTGGDFWPPLAVVIAGGVLGATPLALAFVPLAYRWLLRLQPRLATSPAAELPA